MKKALTGCNIVGRVSAGGSINDVGGGSGGGGSGGGEAGLGDGGGVAAGDIGAGRTAAGDGEGLRTDAGE